MNPFSMLINVFPDDQALARAAAEHVYTLAIHAIAEHGLFSVGLCGGSTPRPVYSLLSRDPFSRGIDWERVHIFWGDERCVPPDHVLSNYRLARETFLDKIPLSPGHIHRMHGEQNPDAAAIAYEDELRTFFSKAGGHDFSGPLFDLILLGMGEDGHTASLFPGSPAVTESERWVLAQNEKEVPRRITLTPVVINSARNVTFIVSGSNKAECMHRVLDGPYQPEILPAQVIRPKRGTLRWLIDASAAGLLEVGETDNRSTIMKGD